MGRAPCCDKAKVKRGPWSSDEDTKLKSYIQEHGTGGNWIALPQKIGLKRCGKSCRLRWLNYLRPNIKHGGFSDEEDNVICALYMTIGSRWSIIAAQLPGRTDNDIKNYWNTKLKKKLLNKQRKEIQESDRQSNTNSNHIIIKRENYTTTICDPQYPCWPHLPATAIGPSPSQQEDNIVNITTSNFHNHPEYISSINDFDYENFDFSSTSTLAPVNNYTTCFQLPNSNGFNNFGINEMDETTLMYGSMEKTCSLPSGVQSGSGITTTSAESTVSWGGDHMNPNFLCSPMVSTISYEDIDHRPQEIMHCAFKDQHDQYLAQNFFFD